MEISAQQVNMKSYSENDVNKETLLRFAQWTTSHDTDAMQAVLDRIHFMVTGSSELQKIGQKSLFKLLADYYRVRMPSSPFIVAFLIYYQCYTSF